MKSEAGQSNADYLRPGLVERKSCSFRGCGGPKQGQPRCTGQLVEATETAEAPSESEVWALKGAPNGDTVKGVAGGERIPRFLIAGLTKRGVQPRPGGFKAPTCTGQPHIGQAHDVDSRWNLQLIPKSQDTTI